MWERCGSFRALRREMRRGRDPKRLSLPRVMDGCLSATDFDLHLPGGRIRAHRFGDPDGNLVLCVPGLSANSRWFDYLGEHIAGDGRQVVALDLRGRGFSALTAPGTYGFKNHARDVLAAAEALGAK